MAYESKTLKGSFKYQATFNNAWLNKDNYRGVATNIEGETDGAYCSVLL